MTNRTVVSIEPGFTESWQMRLLKAPLDIEGARKPALFECDPESLLTWTGEGAVHRHGCKLRQELEKHPAIKEALRDLMKVAPGHAHSFYLQLEVEAAERLCWETLCPESGAFLSLDTRWPIARIADAVIDRPRALYRFAPPLRVMALLSALGRPAAPEWEGLRNAVLSARRNHFEVELCVFVGEQQLLDTIHQEVANGLTGVRVAPIPDRSVELEMLIGTEFRPHLLHFFCHGSASHGVPRLELATILDWITATATSSLRVNADSLLNIPALRDTWLVTLNCCEGGRAPDNMHSIAHRLVAHGVPAAVGVLEPFDAADANEFCAAFYPEIFRKLQQLTSQAAAPGVIEIEWADTLRSPRQSLSEKYRDPLSHRQWALPVMYVRREPFQVHLEPRQEDPEQLRAMRLKASEVAGSLAALPPNAPVEFRRALLDLLKGFPASIQPDLFGNFADGR